MNQLVSVSAGPYSSNRLFEWMMAGAMLLLSFTFALPGDTLGRGDYRIIAWMGEEFFAFLFGTVGAMRCVALYANGRLPVYGPLMRYIGSFVGALCWLNLGLPLAVGSLVSGNVSLVVPVFGMLTLGEFLSVYRAVKDGGYRKR